MTHQERALQVAAECQRLARNLAPFQNRGECEVVNAPKTPEAPLLKEMRERINAVRKEYGLPPIGVSFLTIEQLTEIVNALLNAGNTLAHDHAPKPQELQA